MTKKQCIRCSGRASHFRNHITCGTCFRTVYSFLQDFLSGNFHEYEFVEHKFKFYRINEGG